MVSVPPSGPPAGPEPGAVLPEALISTVSGQLANLALLLDFDGTLSPIVDDPAAARPDPAAAAAIASLADRAALVACITGRPALLARELLGVPSIAYSGLHGAQQLAPGASAPATPAAFAADGARIEQLVAHAGAEAVAFAGLDVERKGPIVALHWRRASDPGAAERRARELGERAAAAGLRVGHGRSVLELRPALEITKGDAVRALLAQHGSPRHVLFAGDDITDLDAYAALRAMHSAGELDGLTLVAVAGEDAPPQVAEQADLVVTSPTELGQLLTQLAELGGAPDPAGGR